MPHPITQVRRKSLWRSKNNRLAKRFAQMRAAKERKRLERAGRADPLPDLSHCPEPPRSRPSGFRVTIRCLDDGERVTFTARRDPWGRLTISPTLAGRKVATVLANYKPDIPLMP